MKTLIVLAMHGAPPTDFPHAELGEYFQLHGQIEAAHHKHGNGNGADVAMAKRYAELDAKIRGWTRTEANDPFYAGSVALAYELEKQSGHKVVVGFNEYCGPSLEEAFEEAHAIGAGRVVVITPMMTSGGEHAEVDIPAKVEEAQRKYPDVGFLYAWPFERKQVAAFLASQVTAFLPVEPEFMERRR